MMVRYAMRALLVVLALTALYGGALLVVGPDGHLLGLRTGLLERGPFHDFLVPGLVLFLLFGIGSGGTFLLSLRGQRAAPRCAWTIGLALLGWMMVQWMIMGSHGVIGKVYVAIGLCLMFLAQVDSRQADH